MKKVLGILDICSFGGLSSNTFIMTEGCLKLEPVVVPTYIYSYQTEMNVEPVRVNNQAFVERTLKQFAERGEKFDGVLIGYVNEENIVSLINYLPLICKEDTKVVLDPILLKGDNKNKISLLEKLSEFATLITPNKYEEKLLDFDECKVVHKGYKVENLVGFIFGKNKYLYERIDAEFLGAGDFFSSLLIGLMVKGYDYDKAVCLASKTLYKILKKTDLSERNYTIDIESNLKLLTKIR